MTNTFKLKDGDYCWFESRFTIPLGEKVNRLIKYNNILTRSKYDKIGGIWENQTQYVFKDENAYKIKTLSSKLLITMYGEYDEEIS